MKSYVYYLYSHLDPEGVRYVGKTNNPKARLACHINDPKGSPKSEWVRAIGRENVSIYIASEHASEDECLKHEIQTIARLRALGCALINTSAGGEPGRMWQPDIKEFPPMTPKTLTLIRKAEGLSIQEFADRLGISRNTLGGYEKGKQPIPAYIALACTAIYRRLTELDAEPHHRIKVFVPSKEGHSEVYEAGDMIKMVVVSNAVEMAAKAPEYRQNKRDKDKPK